MLKIPLEKIIEKIKEQSKLSDAEISSKIKSKTDQLAGLISKEGAAHIIANELGVKLFEEGTLKIKDILSGMKSVETVGKVTNIFNLHEFQRRDGSEGKVGSFIIGDETGRIRVVLWNEQTDLLTKIKSDDIISIKNSMSRENNNNVELHISQNSEIEINPPDKTVGDIASSKQPKAIRKEIKDLSESDSNVELLATIVQAFEPRFYEICPQCKKRIKPKESGYVCPEHGKVEPDYGYVMNIVLDDGSSTIRTVFFRNQLNNLLQRKHEEIIGFRTSPQDFQPIKDSLLGNIIKVIGRTSRNEMFDRLEFVAQLVFPDPDPDEEIKKLEKESEIIE